MRLQEASEREAASAATVKRESVKRDRLRVALSGAALMAEVDGAIASVLRTRPGLKLSETERDALAQVVACDALAAHAERMRTLSTEDAETRGTRAMLRSDVGRKYLAALTRGALKSREGWRDTLDGYRTRSERERGLAGAVAGSRESAESADAERPDGAPRSWLSVALDRERQSAGE